MSFTTSLQLVLEKYIMEQKFISPYLLILIEGIFGLIINTFALLIAYYNCRGNDGDINSFITDSRGFATVIENFNEILPAIKKNKILIVILIFFIFTNFFEELFLVLTNYYISPSYVCTANSTSSFVIWIMLVSYILATFSDTKENLKIYLIQLVISGIGNIIFMIGVLLYNEIIIVHICGMEKNTKREISLKAATTLENDDTFVKEVNKISLRMNVICDA